MNININVANKVATVQDAPVIICGNSDYNIIFSFDAEWSAYEVKTARFIYVSGGKLQSVDVVFEGNTAAVPVLSGVTEVYIGAYAGNLRTTTPARVACKNSILCSDPVHIEPTPDVYNQILELLGASLKEIEDTKKDLQAQIDSIVVGSTADANAAAEVAQARVDSHNKTYDTLQKRLNAEQAEVETLARTVEAMGSEVETLAGTVEAMGSEVEELTEAVETMDKEIKATTSEVAQARALANGTIHPTLKARLDATDLLLNKALISKDIIAKNSDLNKYMTIGSYALYDHNSTNSYANAPAAFSLGGELIVIYGKSNYPRQIIIENDGTLYARAYRGTAWGEWKRTVDVNELNEVKEKAICSKGLLTRGNDLNDYTSVGTYALNEVNSLGSYTHAPEEFKMGGELIVVNGHGSYPRQIIIENDGTLYARAYYGTSWNAWKKAGGTNDEDIYKARLFSVFHRVGVVGDSLASGQGRINDTSHYHDFIEYSWVQCMQRELNNTMLNFTKSGLSTRTWLSDSEGRVKLIEPSNKCQCYIIGLGANDIALGEEYLGTNNDIDLNNYNNNADTYYGNYAKIIQIIKSVEPRAKIFTIENPSFGNGDLRSKFNVAVRYMETIFDNVYNIKLDEKLYTGNDTFIKKNNLYAHSTPLGYQYMASYLLKTLSDYMYDNYSEFTKVNLIGTDYTDPF